MTEADGIGIFDSGVGGLTVLQRLLEAVPREHLLYLGDTARHPYGTKSASVVTRYSVENAEFLMEKGVKMVVVACNTASSVALDTLRERFAVPVIGVIEPGARAAVAASRNRKIGIIGTEATIASGTYTRALRALDPNLEIYTRACPLFVPLAEEGWVDNDVTRQTAALYLASLRKSRIDTLVLGSGYRATVERLSTGVRDAVRERVHARLTEGAVRTIETNVLYATAHRPLDG